MKATHQSEQSSRRVLLHVGPPKTATTTIQAALRSGGDFVYPDPGAMGPGHSELAHRSLGMNGFVAEPQLLVDLVTELDRRSPVDQPIVISAEEFVHTLNHESRADALLRLALRFRTELVITIRPDEERVASLAAQLITMGVPLDLTQYWISTIARPELQPNLVLRFLEVAPWSAAHIVRIDGAEPDHIFASFEDIIGAPIKRVESQRVRWPRVALTVMNELNHLDRPSLPLAERMAFARRVSEMMAHANSDVLEQGLHPAPEEVLAAVRDRWVAELGDMRALAEIGRVRLYESPDGRRRSSDVDVHLSPTAPPVLAKAEADVAQGLHCTMREEVWQGREPRSHPSRLRPQGLILHVGPPKTGTSALQVFLAQNAQVLQRLGLLYPRLDAFDVGEQGGVASGNGFTLAGLLTGIATLKGSDLVDRTHAVQRLLVRLHTELAARPELRGVLLSSEYFTRPSIDDLRTFRSLAASVFEDVCAISVHRDPVELLCSVHEQGTKDDGGLQQTLEEFWVDNGRQVLAQRLRTPIRYANAFGDAAVTVVRYVGSGATGQLLVRNFLEAATGGERDEVERFLASADVRVLKRPVNRSLGPIGRELVRLCNVNRVDRSTVMRLYDEIDGATPEHASELLSMSDALRKDVTDLTQPVVDEIASRFQFVGPEPPSPPYSARKRTDVADATRMQPQEELRWVLEGVARTLSSMHGFRQEPMLRAALTRILSGNRPTQQVHLIQRFRRNPVSKCAAALLPNGIRSALNRLMDRRA